MTIPIAITKLHPHPKNAQLPAVDDATYAAMKADIAAHGILHPVTVNARTWHIVMGHHRVHIAQELGWETVPAELIDVDEVEEERLMVADNILRRQIDKPMDKARLIRWLKELHGVKQGKNDSSLKFNEEAHRLGVSESTLRNLDKLNDLVPALQALVDDGRLPQTVGASLARRFTPAEQQALVDAIGESITQLKLADLQAAKRGPDLSALEARVAALEAERDVLQAQLADAQAAQASAPTSDTDISSSLVESLKRQLNETAAHAQALAAEVARLKAQTPVERIVEKLVPVDKPVPDPAQAERIAQLEAALAAAHDRIDNMMAAGHKRADIAALDAERKALEKRVADLRQALAYTVDAATQADQTRLYRATLAQFIADLHKKLKPLLGDWQRLGRLEPYPVNWMLYGDIQRAAASLEALATGLRRIPLEAHAAQQHQVGVTMVDTTVVRPPRKGEDANGDARSADRVAD